MWKRSRRLEPMPQKFERLGSYNAEVARGIAHTPECAAEMAALQAEFNEWVVRSRP